LAEGFVFIARNSLGFGSKIRGKCDHLLDRFVHDRNLSNATEKLYLAAAKRQCAYLIVRDPCVSFA
jgi:hypothetical protein